MVVSVKEYEEHKISGKAVSVKVYQKHKILSMVVSVKTRRSPGIIFPHALANRFGQLIDASFPPF